MKKHQWRFIRDLPYECISDPWPQLRPRLPRHNWPPAAIPPTRKTPRGAGSILTTAGPTREAGRRARPMGTECVRVLRARGSIGGPGITDSRSQESTRGPGKVFNYQISASYSIKASRSLRARRALLRARRVTVLFVNYNMERALKNKQQQPSCFAFTPTFLHFKCWRKCILKHG